MSIFNNVTQHALQRAKQRANLNKNRAISVIRHARKNGKEFKEFSSWERKYLTMAEHNDSYILAYNGFCYVFSLDKSVCITVYKLPKWFGKKKRFNGKERIRNYKKYCLYNFCYKDTNIVY